jgi:hypothetical protein
MRAALTYPALTCAVLLFADACTRAHDAPIALSSTLVVLPDTQFYSCGFPRIFERQAQWILDHQDERGIALVLHTGDVVDSDVQGQWQVAAESMHRLDGRVPYLIATGNHDVALSRDSLVAQYFQPRELTQAGLTAEAFDPTRIDNSFGIAELAGRSWLFIGLEFAPRDAVVSWAEHVLATHADLPAVLFTHAYLYNDGTRYDRAQKPLQPYHPDSYQYTPGEGVNDGEDLWRKLVEPHENVKLVLSGHVIPEGTARSIATRASGSHVHEVLANYQTCAICPCAGVEGGEGYLRLLEFEPTGKRILVTTYSPHLGKFLSNDENEFVLELD